MIDPFARRALPILVLTISATIAIVAFATGSFAFLYFAGAALCYGLWAYARRRARSRLLSFAILRAYALRGRLGLTLLVNGQALVATAILAALTGDPRLLVLGITIALGGGGLAATCFLLAARGSVRR